MFVTVVAAVFAAVIGTGAPETETAASTSVKASVETAAVVEKKDKVICRSVRVTGTRMADRVCGTREQWDERKRAAKRKTDKLQEGDQWRQNNDMPNGFTPGEKVKMPDPAE